MLGFRFIKVDPSTYLIKYRNGKIQREGVGLSTFYFAPTTSLVCVPMVSDNVNFMFSEITKDFQDVTLQGQITCKVINVHALIKMLNYTLNARGEYISEDPKNLTKRVINYVQVSIRKELSQYELKEAIVSAEKIAATIKATLATSSVLSALGVEVMELSILGIKPNPETARALEAETRELLLRKADDAVYLRRNSAIEQERTIKENELKTEIAVEEKKREIMSKKLESQQQEQEKRREMSEAKIEGDIVLQNKNSELVELNAKNSKIESDAIAYAIAANIEAIHKADPKVIQALTMTGMSPAQLIAASFKELAEKGEKIGQLNISPDLLGLLLKEKNE